MNIGTTRSALAGVSGRSSSASAIAQGVVGQKSGQDVKPKWIMVGAAEVASVRVAPYWSTSSNGPPICTAAATGRAPARKGEHRQAAAWPRARRNGRSDRRLTLAQAPVGLPIALVGSPHPSDHREEWLAWYSAPPSSRQMKVRTADSRAIMGKLR